MTGCPKCGGTNDTACYIPYRGRDADCPMWEALIQGHYPDQATAAHTIWEARMTDQINLTQLREVIEHWRIYSDDRGFFVNDLLALIDTAEAAIEFVTLVRPPHTNDWEWDDLKVEYGDRLRETLDRYHHET